MAMSDFWVKKMKVYFKRIDFDKDGSITKKDFDGMADRFNKTGKLDDGMQKTLKDTMDHIWGKYQEALGHGAEQITEDCFIKAMSELVKSGDKLKPILEAPLPLFFNVVDANNDGFIQMEEYATFFEILGLDPKMAESSFKAIDTNDDGLLSMDEFKEAGSDFFIDQDDSKPSHLFWGSLDE